MRSDFGRKVKDRLIELKDQAIEKVDQGKSLFDPLMNLHRKAEQYFIRSTELNDHLAEKKEFKHGFDAIRSLSFSQKGCSANQ